MKRGRPAGNRNHDPERNAAAYLAGALGPRARRRFEAHLLACETCWGEVRLGRVGRRLAEGARELAPSHLRETVRASVAAGQSDAGGRRPVRRVAAFAAAAVVGLVALGVVVTASGGQPEPISAAVVAFRENHAPAGGPAHHAAPDLGSAGLALTASAREIMGGLTVDAFTYRSDRGERVMLLISEQEFPEAKGAVQYGGTTHAWEAKADGVTMMCVDEPVSYLLLGGNPDLLRRADDAMGSVHRLATG